MPIRVKEKLNQIESPFEDEAVIDSLFSMKKFYMNNKRLEVLN